MSEDPLLPLRLKDLAVGERPQERMEKLGPAALSDTELLAMLLRSGSRGHNVLAVSQGLIAEAGSLPALVRWTEADFRRCKGIGRVKALQLVALMEVARRVLSSGNAIEPVFNRPGLVLQHFQPFTAGLAVEKFWVLCLNRKNRLIKQVEVSSGTATSSLSIARPSGIAPPPWSVSTTTPAAIPRRVPRMCRSPASCGKPRRRSISSCLTMSLSVARPPIPAGSAIIASAKAGCSEQRGRVAVARLRPADYGAAAFAGLPRPAFAKASARQFCI
jgi:RadC-like JAB domain